MCVCVCVEGRRALFYSHFSITVVENVPFQTVALTLGTCMHMYYISACKLVTYFLDLNLLSSRQGHISTCVMGVCLGACAQSCIGCRHSVPWLNSNVREAKWKLHRTENTAHRTKLTKGLVLWTDLSKDICIYERV